MKAICGHKENNMCEKYDLIIRNTTIYIAGKGKKGTHELEHRNGNRP